MWGRRNVSKEDTESFQYNIRKSALRGFTLIELLVVIATVALLAALTLVSVSSSRTKAKIARAQSDLNQLHVAFVFLEHDTNQWPGHKAPDQVEPGAGSNEIWDLSGPANGLTATDGLYPHWGGPYLNFTPVDPWGMPYFFDTDYDIDPSGGTRWATVVGSFGPNKVGQNLYDSDDVVKVLKSE